MRRTNAGRDTANDMWAGRVVTKDFSWASAANPIAMQPKARSVVTEVFLNFIAVYLPASGRRRDATIIMTSPSARVSGSGMTNTQPD